LNHLFCWINQNAAGLTAVFTFLYLIATILIFIEARKSADASKTSAGAATEAVKAAQSSASSASESAALMRKQIKEQAIRCETAVRSGVDTALETTGVWRGRTGEFANMNSLKSLPPTDNLILPRTVVESAALIDVQMAMKLSAALSQMGLARDVIESTRNVDNKGGMNIGHFQRAGHEAAKHLDAAAERLQEVSLFLGKHEG
jgi:hypothetical protein